MNEMLFDDLEEGEIADDIVPEPIVQKKLKPLPRRYVINDKKLRSRHRKKNCKHTTEHHKRKSNKSNFHSHAKQSMKHHKTCHKHDSIRHSNCHFNREKIIEVNSDNEVSPYSHKKVPVVKCAFKNYTSPPRKVLNEDTSKSLTAKHKVVNSNYPKFLSEYKKLPNGQNKLKNISNFNDPCSSANEKQFNKNSSEKNENLKSKLKCENLPPAVEVIDITDDEDEEELRRLALATCLKRSATVPEISSEDSSSKNICSESELPAAIDSDNYEIVDMDVDNESENFDKIGDLFTIDTTPTYFSELNQDSSINQVDKVVNGFLQNITEETYQNFHNEVFNQKVNNDLYTNFEIDKSRLPPSQLDDEFEEELLRAELIANMKSMRQNSETVLKKENILSSDALLVNDKFKNVIPKETRVVKLKSDNCNERIVNINRDTDVDEGLKDERTVSILKDTDLKETPFVTKSRTVSSYKKPNLTSNVNPSVRKADIKVKLNNVQSVASSVPNIISLPQERIVISLNNETSSDDSDQEEDFQAKQPEKNPAVASLEALISNARLQSDEKKNPPNINGTSDALSCLSKAQQEEYNSLIKILAKNKDPFVQSSQLEVKKVTEDPNLILLKKKIHIAKDNCEKEKVLMSTTEKEVEKRKRSYMLSKIKTQHLKEQLIAAEKVRKANLQIWTKCSSELQTLKKSVSKRQALIKSLQTKISAYFPETVSNGLSPMSSITSEEYLLR
ncbi:protein hook homolog [Parasteatoda tepidariorum]|uniref:protein hook homolog n=1 Tax=Parasteatoda tepidariorum TaxID=114398 RepID=UPI001C72344C|nr:uncharacterized protein LOC107438449 [Parasteatoda tepidariorum]